VKSILRITLLPSWRAASGLATLDAYVGTETSLGSRRERWAQGLRAAGGVSATRACLPSCAGLLRRQRCYL
jgi:hypothetical protein